MPWSLFSYRSETYDVEMSFLGDNIAGQEPTQKMLAADWKVKRWKAPIWVRSFVRRSKRTKQLSFFSSSNFHRFVTQQLDHQLRILVVNKWDSMLVLKVTFFAGQGFPFGVCFDCGVLGSNWAPSLLVFLLLLNKVRHFPAGPTFSFTKSRSY